jgi:hypothetical protein
LSKELLDFSVPTPKADKTIEETQYSRYSITEYCKIITHRCNELLKKTSNLPNPLKEQLQKEITKLANTIILYIRYQAHKIGIQESDNIIYISTNEILHWSTYLEHYIKDLHYREQDIALLSSVTTNSQYSIIVQCSSHYVHVLQRCLVLGGYHCVSTQEDNSFVSDYPEDQLDTSPLFRRNDHSLKSPEEIDDLVLWSEEFPSKKVLLFFSECNL